MARQLAENYAAVNAYNFIDAKVMLRVRDVLRESRFTLC